MRQRKYAFVVAAAGEGRRMRAAFPDTPKPLLPVAGKSMLDRLTDTIERTDPSAEMVIVVSPELVDRMAQRHHRGKIAVQRVPRGTGDAVRCARGAVSDDRDAIVILFVDQPLISPATLRRLIHHHHETGATITIVTVPLPDFNDWRAGFFDWGRVLRDPSGQVVRIVEARDATTDELGVTEVNPSLYCVDAAWLWNAIGELEASGAQGEVLLTDIVPLALRSGRYVNTVPIENALEAVGANSPEQLKILEAVANRLERRTA